MRPCPPSFNFQYSLLSVRSSSSFLRLLPRLPVVSIFHSIFHWITCFTRQFLRKMSPIQLVFIRFIVGRMLFSSLTIWFFTRFLQLISCPSLSHTTFWNIPAIYDLLFEVSNLQHYIKLRSRCSTLLISSFNLSKICWWKVPSSCGMLHFPWQSWI